MRDLDWKIAQHSTFTTSSQLPHKRLCVILLVVCSNRLSPMHSSVHPVTISFNAVLHQYLLLRRRLHFLFASSVIAIVLAAPHARKARRSLTHPVFHVPFSNAFRYCALTVLALSLCTTFTHKSLILISHAFG